MTLTEFLTTYLAIGAPFGVYYFFTHFGKLSRTALLTNSIGVVLLWFWFAARLLKQRAIFLRNSSLKAPWNLSRKGKIEETTQNVLDSFIKFSTRTGAPTYFEFRETLERFVGLTLASQQSSVNSPAASHESEIFRIVGHHPRALRLAENISHRKNYLRLQTHQALARQDFLRVCRDLQEKVSADESGDKVKIWQSYQSEVARLLNLLKDENAVQSFANLSESLEMMPDVITTGETPEERELWANLSSRPTSKAFPITVSARGLRTGAPD